MFESSELSYLLRLNGHVGPSLHRESTDSLIQVFRVQISPKAVGYTIYFWWMYCFSAVLYCSFESVFVFIDVCQGDWHQTFQPPNPLNLEVWRIYMKKPWDLGHKPWDFTKTIELHVQTTHWHTLFFLLGLGAASTAVTFGSAPLLHCEFCHLTSFDWRESWNICDRESWNVSYILSCACMHLWKLNGRHILG